LCAGTCGRLIWRGRGTLPPGQAMCRNCRGHGRDGPCPGCGSAFTPTRSASGYRSRVCSVECGNIVRKLGRDAAHPPAPPPRCEVCGEEYRRTYRDQRTCGRICGMWVNRRTNTTIAIPVMAPAVWNLCRECGQPTPKHICSATCIEARQRRLVREWYYAHTSPPAQRTCVCGDSIEPSAPPQQHQCGKCSEERRREVKRQARRRRRARERSVESEPYTLAEIAERDKYRCGICRKRVAMTKSVPHPKAPTIDHIIPISQLGPDIKTNVRLAHFWCNSVRGAGDDEAVQLLLVG
jgi:hypothetical protein